MKAVILVAIGGAVGAVGRHLIGLASAGTLGKALPYGTLFANGLGSFMLGALVAWVARTDASPEVKLLIGTGLCGALTTFSTFSVETLQLLEQGQRGAAVGNLVCNLVVGLGLAGLGLGLFR